jgi:hypothetical protein
LQGSFVFLLPASSLQLEQKSHHPFFNNAVYRRSTAQSVLLPFSLNLFSRFGVVGNSGSARPVPGFKDVGIAATSTASEKAARQEGRRREAR